MRIGVKFSIIDVICRDSKEGEKWASMGVLEFELEHEIVRV